MAPPIMHFFSDDQATPAALGVARHLFIQVEHPGSSPSFCSTKWARLTLSRSTRGNVFLYFLLSFFCHLLQSLTIAGVVCTP